MTGKHGKGGKDDKKASPKSGNGDIRKAPKSHGKPPPAPKWGKKGK